MQIATFLHSKAPVAEGVVVLKLCFGAAAALLLIFLSCSLFLFWMPAPAAASVATSCPIGSLPPTPTSGQPADPPAAIQFSEMLTNPKKDWNCDGNSGSSDQWIELQNHSTSDVSLFGLQLSSKGNIVALNATFRIAAGGYLVIFSNQIPSIPLFAGFGTIGLLDSQGNTIDTVNYPPLGPDQSYIRNSSGQWTVSDTPTPGAPNSNGSSPTPTPTRRSGGGGSGGGGGAPTATPTPIGSVFIPTDTPDLALQHPGNGGAASGKSDPFPSWLKTTLLIAMGAGLLAVVVWYIRSWGKGSESDT